MPELLLELFSEEIPARMQAGAARDLERLAREHLGKAGLSATLATYAGPRRLTLLAEGLARATPDREEEVRGPRTSAPEQALEGFLRKTGIARDQLVQRDGAWFANLSTRGRATADVIAEMAPAIIASFPWPKSMRSGSSGLRWVRPLKRIVCLFDGEVIGFEAGGIVSGDLTEGHRFMGEGHAPFAVTDFSSYQAALRDHYVLLDPNERRQLILNGARAVCAGAGLELVEDEGLLDELSGLAEWPVPLLGRMDPTFLDLPAEVIRTSMRTHQKYFAVRDPRTAGSPGALAAHFVVVANIEPQDGGAVIAAGNAKVLSARLNDARFFWDQDLTPGAFVTWSEKLKGVTFHAKLGSLAERVQRIEALARQIAPQVGADPELAGLAAHYSKADLASGMVGEFPELQGIMGGYYARAIGKSPAATGAPHEDGERGKGVIGLRPSDHRPSLEQPRPPGFVGRSDAEIDLIADAIRDHYKPVGPSDSTPTAPTTVAVALADKLDTLVSFFAIDEKPTGSKDPYALRRAALGVIAIILENQIRFAPPPHAATAEGQSLSSLLRAAMMRVFRVEDVSQALSMGVATNAPDASGVIVNGVLGFLIDRLKVLLRDQGKRHDLVDAVFALGDDELVRVIRRVEALSDFLATQDGANLLAGYKRATNILKAEEKKHPAEVDLYRLSEQLGALTTPEEEALAAALRVEVAAVDEALDREDFTRAMHHLAHLRAPVDAFFDKVMVNASDPDVRLTRLRLLTQVRDTANRVADFSLISG